MFQQHYNFLCPKICISASQFHFLINKIYSVCLSAKRSLKWWIFENLQLVAWTNKRYFWSCVAHWSETAPCFLTVNSVGSWFNYFLRSGIQNTGLWYIHICCGGVCVCLCVCVSVYVCVFFHCEGFFRLQDFQDILEGTDQRSCVVNISWVFSAKFHHLRIWKCHVSPPKTKTTGEETIWYNALRKKMVYIDIRYKSALHKPTSDEKILKITRLL